MGAGRLSDDDVARALNAWRDSIPPSMRRKSDRWATGASRATEAAKAKRDEIAAEIIAMHRRGVGIQKIALTMGRAANTITRILRENGIDPKGDQT